MKIDGFHASTSGGKRVMAVSLILALVLASLSVIGVFAAPPNPNNPTPNDRSSGVTANQIRELNADQAWFNNLRLQPGNLARSSDPAKAQQWLSQYAFALGQAGTVVRGSANAANTNSSNGSSSSTNSTNQSNGQVNSQSLQTGQQGLGQWLHMLRGLRQKLDNIGVTAGGNTMARNNTGAGVPVTGGSSSSTSGSSSSSSTGSAATPTATPSTGTSSSSGTGSSSSSSSSSTSNAGIPNTGQTSIQNNNNNNSLAKIWGNQFRELQAAQAWYDNFRTKPGMINNSSDQARMQQWLDQYAFALRQAGALIKGGTAVNNQSNTNTNGQSTSNNQANGQVMTNRSHQSAQQQLGDLLHMMRGLREKLSGLSQNTSADASSTSIP